MGYVSVMESEGVGFNGRVYTVLAKLYFAQRDWKAALALLQVSPHNHNHKAKQSQRRHIDSHEKRKRGRGGGEEVFCVVTLYPCLCCAVVLCQRAESEGVELEDRFFTVLLNGLGQAGLLNKVRLRFSHIHNTHKRSKPPVWRDPFTHPSNFNLASESTAHVEPRCPPWSMILSCVVGCVV
jgi:hypothetical protein